MYIHSADMRLSQANYFHETCNQFTCAHEINLDIRDDINLVEKI